MENWKQIEGFEGLYEVSDLGRIKSVQRVVSHSSSGVKTIPERIKRVAYSNGYQTVSLWKDNLETRKLVHRVVAAAFIPNPDNLPEVNHKNGDKMNNCASELEWVTASQNQLHSYRVLGRVDKKRFGSDNNNAKKVCCLTFGVTFNTAVEAAKALGVQKTAISQVCNNRRVHTEGLHFKYV